MTIRGGNILHSGRDFLIDRVQNVNTTLGLTPEKIRELGNKLAVATIRENPDITFTVESFDYTTEVEALLTRQDPDTVANGFEFDLTTGSKPIDIISAYVDDSFDTVKSVGLPYLYLEQADWRFAVRQSATKRFQLRGDSVFFVPGETYFQTFAAAGVGPYVFTHSPAIEHVDEGASLYALCVTAFYTDGSFERLFLGQHYTNTATGFTLTTSAPAGAVYEVMYGAAATTNTPQSEHPLTTVKPAAIRHRNVDVYLSDGAATPTLVKLAGLQSAEISLRLTATITEELGNAHAVSRESEDPDVSGNLTMRPRDVSYMFAKIAQAANVPANKVVGALSSTPLQMQIRVSNPDTFAVIETFQIDDARIEPPGPSPQVGQPLEITLPFTSDTGKVRVFKGTP